MLYSFATTQTDICNGRERETWEGETRHRRYLCIAYHSRVDWPSSNRRFDFHRTSLPAKFNCVWLLCDGRTTPRKKGKKKRGETTVESPMSLLRTHKNPRPVLGSSCIHNNISVMAANISLSLLGWHPFIYSFPINSSIAGRQQQPTNRATGEREREKSTLVLIFTRADDDRHNMEIQSNQIPYIVIETTK